MVYDSAVYFRGANEGNRGEWSRAPRARGARRHELIGTAPAHLSAHGVVVHQEHVALPLHADDTCAQGVRRRLWCEHTRVYDFERTYVGPPFGARCNLHSLSVSSATSGDPSGGGSLPCTRAAAPSTALSSETAPRGVVWSAAALASSVRGCFSICQRRSRDEGAAGKG